VSNLKTAQSGDRRRALEVLRDTLAAGLDAVDPNVLPQLAAQYRATLADIEALPRVTAVIPKKDELRERRNARRRNTGKNGGTTPPTPIPTGSTGR